MATPALDTCEAKIDGTSRPISVTEAKSMYVMASKRCSSCHWAVVLSGSYSGTGSRRFSHRRVHTGCPQDPKRYSGLPAPHPQALT
jgi:hypothetical protein